MTPNKSVWLIKLAKALCALVFWAELWQLAAMLVGQELIFPAPIAVFKALVRLSGTGDFWYTALFSLGRVFTGFLLGVLLGTLLGALTCGSRIADTLLSPAIRVVRSTPVASFILLALLWVGKMQVPGFISMLMVIPVVWENVCTGIRGTKRELLEMAGAYRFGRLRTLRLVYIPSVLPAWRAGCVTALGLAWKSGVAAEVLCQPRRSLGTEIYYSKIYLETADLFAWTAVVIILSYLLERIFVLSLGRKGERV